MDSLVNSPMNTPSSMGDLPTRDAKYYFPDGDLTILISDTLFKVHKHLLTRDGSVFEDMLAPIKEELVEDPSFLQDGTDDEHPIVMEGDTVDKFQDFLWALYALPHEILEASSPGLEDLLKLYNVASFAHKYQFSTTETWALRALFTYFSDRRTVGIVSADIIAKVTEVTWLCDDWDEDLDLFDCLVRHWRMIFERRRDLGLAITTFERLCIDNMCGEAYMAMLMAGRDAWKKDPFLTQRHHTRLLCGYYNVSELCDSLPSKPPQFTHPRNCIYGPEECNRLWYALWRSITVLQPNGGTLTMNQHERLDIVGRLRTANNIVQQLTYNPTLHSFHKCINCFISAHDAAKELLSDTEETLLELFDEDRVPI